MRTKGYSQLKFDVSAVAVPAKWTSFAYEYRHGYGKGLERDGVYNPIPARSSHAREEYCEPDDVWIDPREAWFVGYAAGKQDRKTSNSSPLQEPK